MSLLLLFSARVEVLSPDADSAAGSWTNELGGATLYTSIDEASASDSDYIQSSQDPVSDVCKISLSNPVGSLTDPVTVSYRYGKLLNNARQIDLTVRLLQTTTQIATWTHTNISSTLTTASQTLTSGQTASITNFTALFLEFTANAP